MTWRLKDKQIQLYEFFKKLLEPTKSDYTKKPYLHITWAF